MQANLIPCDAHIKCVLAADGLCGDSGVFVSSDGCHGISPDVIMTKDDFLADTLESPTAFRDVLADNASKVFQAPFAWQLEPLYPLKFPPVLYATPRRDRKTHKEDLELIDEFRRVLYLPDLTMPSFAVGNDPQHDAIHCEHDKKGKFELNV
jgi:hypothetical protein